MVANKYLIADQSKILRAKLDNLSNRLQHSLKGKDLQTKEAYLFEAIKILDEFYKSLNEPKLTVSAVRMDDYPDPELYNKLWQDLLDDLIAIFKEMENVESLAVANFNFVSTEANRLVARLKSVSSKLGDYILYAVDASKDFIYFKDSFNDVSRIEVNSSLLNSEQAEINQVEGIVTLPIDRSKDSRITIKEVPVINSSSNGVVGNNQELGALWNGNMSVLLDSNPDTWFEYERVVSLGQDDNTPLVLDLTINLGEEKVINHVRVNPNNFGTKTIVKIEEISTSLDGQSYISIKDDIPIAGFTTEDEENIFTLAPSISKFAGQGIYSFTPRKVKYIRFLLKQEEPYIITTLSGDRFRYAIGIRDIDVQAFSYKSKGEIISKPFDSLDEIRKVILQTNQSPSEISDLAEIRYYISPDDGSTWCEISPENFSDGQYRVVKPDTTSSGITVERIPELLEFNGSSAQSIITAIPVTSIRLKAQLTRDDTAFKSGSSSMQKEKLTASELHAIPNAAPFSFDLEHAPVNKTVIVVDPMFGCRGDIGTPYVIGYVQGGSLQSKYRLPFTTLPRPMKKESDGSGHYRTIPVPASEWMHVEVNGEEWSHATQPITSYTGGTSKVFALSLYNSTLQFGNGLDGKHPGDGAMIELYFDAERLYPTADYDEHLAKLDFGASSNKDTFIIKRYEPEAQHVQKLPLNATVIKLTYAEISDYSDIESKLSPKTRVEYVNGRDELTDDSYWSIDIGQGIIYLRTPIDPGTDTVVSFKYLPVHILGSDQWDWGTTDLLRDSIQIKESAWKTISKRESLTPVNNAKVLELSNLSIEKGTLLLATTNGGTPVSSTLNPFLKEVDYLNGATELKGEATKTEESVPVLSSGSQVFTLKELIHTSSVYPVVFSKADIFATDVSPSTPSSVGEYKIDRLTGEIAVVIDTTIPEDFGIVTYYYRDSGFSDDGLYSVDYKLGKIYTQRAMDSSWTVVARYEYSDFRAEYRIARVLNTNDYQVDIANKRIKIKDEEVYRRAALPQRRLDGFSPQYLVNYDYVAETRENIQDLMGYFSPIIKDYALKVLMKGRIF